jgi:pyruvate/2-oxoglutarate/acetoin dehydrogenase E1 component
MKRGDSGNAGFRGPSGNGRTISALQALELVCKHSGLKVVVPSTVYDARFG